MSTYRIFDLVMVNFFHQNEVIASLNNGDDVVLKSIDYLTKEDESILKTSKYIKARPAIIIAIIKDNKNDNVLGYIVAPLTTKFKPYLSHKRTAIESNCLAQKSYIKWDAISTIGRGEIVNVFRKNGMKASFGNGAKKYITKSFKLHFNLTYKYLLNFG